MVYMRYEYNDKNWVATELIIKRENITKILWLKGAAKMQFIGMQVENCNLIKKTVYIWFFFPPYYQKLISGYNLGFSFYFCLIFFLTLYVYAFLQH